MPNTNQLPPEIQEIREVVATGISVDICAKCAGVGEVCDNCRLPQGYEYEIADQLFSELSKHGVVLLDKDQAFASVPPQYERYHRDSTIWFEGQREYKKAGARKVVNLDGTPLENK